VSKRDSNLVLWGIGFSAASVYTPNIFAPVEERTNEAQNQDLLAGHPLFTFAVYDCCENSQS
jgi:hypothetical protein